MRKQNAIALFFIILFSIALYFQEDIWELLADLRRGNDPRPVVASIATYTEDVKYRFPDTLSWRKARTNLDLRDMDTISTGPNSTAVVHFKSGLKVELQPNSLIVVHNYGGGPDSLELTFLQGGVKVLDQSGVAIPLTEEKIQKPLEIDLAKIPEPTPSPPPVQKVALEEKVKATPTPRPHKQVKETLPDAYISTVIRGQRNLLNRCYAQHLRLNPDAKGRIDTSLTIDPDGTMSSARVVSSTISDPVLQQCVVTSLQRAKFRSYNGDPIIVSYPINFE